MTVHCDLELSTPSGSRPKLEPNDARRHSSLGTDSHSAKTPQPAQRVGGEETLAGGSARDREAP